METAQLKILSVFVLLAVSFVGILIPVKLVHTEGRHVKFAFEMLRCVSIGLIVGVAFLHLLPDAVEKLQIVSSYPFAYLFVSLGCFLMLFLEQCTKHLAEQKTEKSAEKALVDGVAPGQQSGEEDHSEDHTHHDHHDNFHSHYAVPMALSREHHKLKAYVIESSIAIHSILIGIGLGVQEYDVEPLFIALSFHQLFEGIALGGAVAKVHQTRCFLTSLIILFSFSCPIGVAIGIGITEYFEQDTLVAWISGTFESLATGTLLYIGVYDLMGDSFHQHNYGMKKFQMVFAVLLGAGVMAVIAIWA